MRDALLAAIDTLASRRVLLFGGKGGVGKTTVASLVALHLARTRTTRLFTTDPASNLADLFGGTDTSNLTIEAIDAPALYERFLHENLEMLLEVGDRGTYLDRQELRRFFELSLPGIDELMAWMRIGELAEEDADSIVVVDTAPTGHTLRMLGSGEHFRQFAAALDAMEAKHRGMVRQFMRRDVRDAVDAFIERFDRQAAARRELLADPARSAFVPIFLAEPLVVEQTVRLVREVQGEHIDVPFAVLNRSVEEADCARDRERLQRQAEAARVLAPLRIETMPRSCVPITSIATLLGSAAAPPPEPVSVPQRSVQLARMTFLAGKGGVGKTTTSASIALQLARSNPGGRYVAVSVDPAHSLRDIFRSISLPPNLTIEAIDTKAKWASFRATVGEQISRAMSSLTPGGMSIAYDEEAMQRLIEIAPPGADEIFAVSRLAELAADDSIDAIVVDTAPTGHFLRLLDLPKSAGEWVREFMRILLRYRELVPSGSLGEELVHASRSLKRLDETLRSSSANVVLVTRPEQIVVAETRRLAGELERRGIAIGGVIANYVTPETDCACDRSMRSYELAALAAIERPVELIERRDQSLESAEALESLVTAERPERQSS